MTPQIKQTSMANVKTIVTVEADEATTCSDDNCSTFSHSSETNNFKLVVFDRNILALVFFLALFLLSITMVHWYIYAVLILLSFNNWWKYFSGWSHNLPYYLPSSEEWRHFPKRLGNPYGGSLYLTHFLASSFTILKARKGRWYQRKRNEWNLHTLILLLT